MKKLMTIILTLISISVFSKSRQQQNKGGHYTAGSSHKGEHYRNKKTHNHYTHSKT